MRDQRDLDAISTRRAAVVLTLPRRRAPRRARPGPTAMSPLTEAAGG
jgi:hypothetical protein